MFKNLLAVAGILVMMLAGCGGQSSDATADADGGAATTSIAIQAVDSAPQASLSKESPDATDSAGGMVSITVARAAVEQIEVEQPDGRTCDEIEIELEDCSCVESGAQSSQILSSETEVEDSSDENELHFAGPFVVDLLMATSTPPLDTVVIPSGVYHELQLKLSPLDPSSTLVPESDMLLGNSMVLEGTYDADQGAQMFRILLSLDHEIKFESDAGLAITESAQVNRLILSLDVNSWFAGIDVGACLESGAAMQDAEGVFIIDSSVQDPACMFDEALKENIESSSSTEASDDSVDDATDDSPSAS